MDTITFLHSRTNNFSFIQPSNLAEAGSNISFDSIQKMSLLAIGSIVLCYCAVSPHTLPPVEYNAKFYENIRLVSLMMIAPILNFLMVFDPKESDINNDVNAFYVAFTVGYAVTFVLEVILTTLIRLGVFAWLEPDVFQLTPQVPLPVLPWVLRENKYRPKRITLFAADFATSCVACPIIEEYVKLKILQWSARLPRFVFFSRLLISSWHNAVLTWFIRYFVPQKLHLEDEAIIQEQEKEAKDRGGHSPLSRREGSDKH